jgi:hypothetical protein
MRYGTSYFANRILRHVREDMKELAAEGFSYVLHTFSEYDLLFHKGNMADIVAVSREAGLETHVSPWGVGKVFGGEPFSNFVSQHAADACQVLDDGRTVAMACPNAPAFGEFMRRWTDAAISLKPDAVFWDEPHFHEQGFLSSVKGRWGCRCQYCQKAFMAQFGYAMPDEENADVHTFKEGSIRRFIESLTHRTKEAGIKNILYMTPSADVNASIAKWESYAGNADLDTLATGPYWKLLNFPLTIVGDYAAALKRLCDRHKINAQLWMQCFLLKAEEVNELKKAVGLAADNGIEDMAFWSYEASEHESFFTCDDPGSIWETVRSIVRKTSRTT